jgi:hypothetical protein
MSLQEGGGLLMGAERRTTEPLLKSGIVTIRAEWGNPVARAVLVRWTILREDSLAPHPLKSSLAMKWMLTSVLLLAAGARAEPADPARQEISLGVSQLQYWSLMRPSESFFTLEAAYTRPVGAEGFWRALRVSGGLRTGMPAAAAHFPLEAFARAQLTLELGPWEAAAGPELGVSGFARLVPRPRWAENFALLDLEDERLGLGYLTFGVAPLRFRFGSFLVSALELHLGTSAFPLGSALRTQVGLLRVGGSL